MATFLSRGKHYRDTIWLYLVLEWAGVSMYDELLAHHDGLLTPIYWREYCVSDIWTNSLYIVNPHDFFCNRTQASYNINLLLYTHAQFIHVRTPCRLVIQRTKRIDESQELLLDMLEDLTSGTEEERQEFMASCVETLKKFKMTDLITPIFVFERLCNIIHPVSIL